MLPFIVYTIFIQITFFFHILFLSFSLGLKAANIHPPSFGVLVQPLRMLVQSEPHSHTEYVHLEPSPGYGSSQQK
jgi:hypothetical protein